MSNNITLKKYKKRVIKWENVISLAYVIITLFKYFITTNNDLLILFYDLYIDTFLGIMIYQLILTIRKESL